MLNLIKVVGCVSTLVLGVAACVGDPGAEGPAGSEGPAGPAGPEGPGVDAPPPVPGVVLTLSNDPTYNAVFAYDRAADGSLTPRDVYLTGGAGTGAGLGNQGALAYSMTKQLVFAVNPGDGSLSTFKMHEDRSLTLLSKVASGGVAPISVTVNGDYVYALNAGDATHAANITGFHIDPAGLTAVAASTRALSTANPGPAQISFSPDGNLLVVSEKGTNKLDTFVVTAGIAGPVYAQPSAGTTPFGFAFTAQGQLIVSEAAGGAPGASTASSYTLSTSNGKLTTVSHAVASSQSAACWAVIGGGHVYVSNTASNNLSAYIVAADGSLALEGTGVSASTGMGPTDMAVTAAGDFLYVIDSKTAALSSYVIATTGGLTQNPDFVGLPMHATGLLAL